MAGLTILDYNTNSIIITIMIIIININSTIIMYTTIIII